jgi:hypothetical protein
VVENFLTVKFFVVRVYLPEGKETTNYTFAILKMAGRLFFCYFLKHHARSKIRYNSPKICRFSVRLFSHAAHSEAEAMAPFFVFCAIALAGGCILRFSRPLSDESAQLRGFNWRRDRKVGGFVCLMIVVPTLRGLRGCVLACQPWIFEAGLGAWTERQGKVWQACLHAYAFILLFNSGRKGGFPDLGESHSDLALR